MRKNVTSLKIGDHMYTRTPSILAKFTENLPEKYNKAHSLPLSADKFIAQNISNSLNAVESEGFEQPISLTELTDPFKAMKKGRSPGSNGYTAGFFKYFWKKLGPFLHRALIFCIQKRKKHYCHIGKASSQ